MARAPSVGRHVKPPQAPPAARDGDAVVEVEARTRDDLSQHRRGQLERVQDAPGMRFGAAHRDLRPEQARDPLESEGPDGCVHVGQLPRP